MRAPHRCGNWTIPVTARHTAHYLSRIIMNWFVNENTCFPPLASIYAFYRVHLATPSLFPTPPLSLSIVSILSIHPLSGHPSAAHPPPSYLSHAFTPRDNPLRPVPLCPPMSAIVSVYRVHIIVMTLRRYGDLRGGGGRRRRSEKSRKLAFETVCVWTDADFRSEL